MYWLAAGAAPLSAVACGMAESEPCPFCDEPMETSETDGVVTTACMNADCPGQTGPDSLIIGTDPEDHPEEDEAPAKQ